MYRTPTHTHTNWIVALIPNNSHLGGLPSPPLLPEGHILARIGCGAVVVGVVCRCCKSQGDKTAGSPLAPLLGQSFCECVCVWISRRLYAPHIEPRICTPLCAPDNVSGGGGGGGGGWWKEAQVYTIYPAARGAAAAAVYIFAFKLAQRSVCVQQTDARESEFKGRATYKKLYTIPIRI